MWRNFSDILAWCTSLEQLTCGFSLLFSHLSIFKVAFLLFFIRSSQSLLDGPFALLELNLQSSRAVAFVPCAFFLQQSLASPSSAKLRIDGIDKIVLL